MSEPDFLSRLQHEAQLQAKIHEQRWLPSQLDPLSSFIGQYAWQTLAIAAIITSLLVKWGTAS